MAKKEATTETCLECGKSFTGPRAISAKKGHQQMTGHSDANAPNQAEGKDKKPSGSWDKGINDRLRRLEKAIPENFCETFPHLCKRVEDIAQQQETSNEAMAAGHPRPNVELLESFLNCPECQETFVKEFMPEAAARLGYTPPPAAPTEESHEEGSDEETDEVSEPPPTVPDEGSEEAGDEAGAENEIPESEKSVIFGDEE